MLLWWGIRQMSETNSKYGGKVHICFDVCTVIYCFYALISRVEYLLTRGHGSKGVCCFGAENLEEENLHNQINKDSDSCAFARLCSGFKYLNESAWSASF